ncbi:proliferation-associated protein 2G4-like isoform X2 [Planococcus citri]|uniref:proliferation-associated protein 2G4-like isoform X2 n=1 Tax=Planococcus citri TaxID=170843 RepID=UPI0031F82BCA
MSEICKEGHRILLNALKIFMAKDLVGESPVILAAENDQRLIEECTHSYKRKKFPRGLFNKTRIIVNGEEFDATIELQRHFKINEEDIITIDMGVHIDGYPSIVAWSTIAKNKITKFKGDKADVFKCSHQAFKAVVMSMIDGCQITKIENILKRFSTTYGCCLKTGICCEVGKVINSNNTTTVMPSKEVDVIKNDSRYLVHVSMSKSISADKIAEVQYKLIMHVTPNGPPKKISLRLINCFSSKTILIDEDLKELLKMNNTSTVSDSQAEDKKTTYNELVEQVRHLTIKLQSMEEDMKKEREEREKQKEDIQKILRSIQEDIKKEREEREKEKEEREKLKEDIRKIKEYAAILSSIQNILLTYRKSRNL